MFIEGMHASNVYTVFEDDLSLSAFNISTINFSLTRERFVFSEKHFAINLQITCLTVTRAPSIMSYFTPLEREQTRLSSHD